MSFKILGGAFKGTPLFSPKTQVTRPTQAIVRQSLFNVCRHQIEGSAFLDLYAGSGSIGFEALSHGANRVVFVEKHPAALSCLKKNLIKLQAQEQSRILALPVSQALKKLQKEGEKFDLIYIDPPYQQTTQEDLPLLLGLLGPSSTVFIEERYMPQAISPSCPGLQEVRTRKFGSTLLREYRPL